MDNKKTVTLTLILAAFTLLAAATVVEAQTYQTIKTITGASDQSTEYFNVPSSEWRLSWSYTSSHQEYAGFYVYVYQQGSDSGYYESFSASTNQNSGTYYIHDASTGNYYVKVSAANLDSYTITVESEAASPTPTVPEFSAAMLGAALVFAGAGVVSVIAIKMRNVKNRSKLEKKEYGTE